MDELKRYYDSGVGTMVADPQGEYIKYDDLVDFAIHSQEYAVQVGDQWVEHIRQIGGSKVELSNHPTWFKNLLQVGDPRVAKFDGEIKVKTISTFIMEDIRDL